MKYSATLLVASALFGCGDNSAPASAYDCVRDEAALAALTSCVGDSQCACGAHCELGQCVAACKTTSDCDAGEQCDGYGRCRAAGTTALIPPAPTTTDGDLSAPATMHLAADGTALVPVQVVKHDIAHARIAASHGAVSCKTGDAVAASCDLTDLALGATFDVTATRDPAAAADDLFVLTLITQNARHTVSLPVVGQGASDPPVALQPVHGTYNAGATLRTTGLGATASAIGGLMDLPLSAQVWGDSGTVTVQLADPFGALTSAGSLVGTATIAADANHVLTGPLTFPVQPFASGALRDSPWQAIGTVSATLTLDARTGLGNIALTEEFAGLGYVTDKPRATWTIALSRAGDTTGAAPSVPSDAVLGYDEDTVVARPTAFEVAAAKPFAAYASQSTAGRQAAWNHLVGKPANLDACFLAPSTTTRADAIGVYLGAVAGNGGTTAQLATRVEPLLSTLGNTWFRVSTGASTLPVTQVQVTAISGFTITPGYTDLDLVPCQWAFDGFSVTAPSGRVIGGNPNITPFIVDHCSQMAAQGYATTGNALSPTSLHSPFSAQVTLQVTYVDGASSTGFTTESVDVTISGQGVNAFRLPPTPLHCAAGLACIEPTTATTPGSAAAAAFTGPALAISGDAQCASGARTAAIDLDAAAESGTPPTASAAFEGCLAALTAARTTALVTPADAYAAGLGEALLPSSCIDVVREVTAAEAALDNDRHDAPGAGAARASSSAYGYRLLARWLELHAFFASEEEQRMQVTALLTGTPPLSPQDALAASVAGWDLVFLPRTGRALAYQTAAEIAAPDYRTGIIAGDNTDAQRAGLWSSMMDTLAHQASLLDAYLQQRLRAQDTSAIAQIHTVMPRFVLARAIANGLADRARSTNPVWLKRFTATDGKATSAMAAALVHAHALISHGNPLGIEDSDLPLYFLADDATGPGGKFAAISDFLLGTGPGSTAWAPTLLAQAEASEAAARQRYVDQQQRAYQSATTAQTYDDYVGDTHDSIEETLREYCGVAEGSLLDDDNFSAARCFFKADPACLTNVPDYYRTWSTTDYQTQVCIGAALATAGGGFADPAVQQFAQACGEDAPFQTVACPAGVNADICVQCGGSDVLGLSLGTFQLQPLPDDGANGLNNHQALQTIENNCVLVHSGGRVYVPMPVRSADAAQCVTGSLGDSALDILAAQQEIDMANANISVLYGQYQAQMDGCHIIAKRNQDITAATEAYNARMLLLSQAKQASDDVGAFAQAGADCASTGAGADETTPWGAATGIACTIAACVADGAVASSVVISGALQGEMDQASLDHDAELAMLEDNAELDTCYNDAKATLLGMQTNTVALSQASLDLARAQAKHLELINAAQIYWKQGRDTVAQLELSRIAPPSGTPWLDEQVTTYTQRMTLARRAAYLAVRAVEYEFQASLGERDLVIAAETPEQLETALSSLWATSGTRGIGGGSPDAHLAVISLRDDVLHLDDTTNLPAGFRPMTAAQRFHEILQSQQYAAYDASGRYEGQRIPFKLAPKSADDATGVTLANAHNCAERMWSVNAAIQGANGASPWQGSDTTFAEIELLKQNTFYSQWCTAPAGTDAPKFQVASVRPGHNLLREPGIGAPQGVDIGGNSGSVSAETRSLIDAHFNVARADLESDGYDDGQTSELAARGLYGTYELFIPADKIAKEADGGGYTEGLVLDHIDDILLRLDYVSVAN